MTLKISKYDYEFLKILLVYNNDTVSSFFKIYIKQSNSNAHKKIQNHFNVYKSDLQYGEILVRPCFKFTYCKL